VVECLPGMCSGFYPHQCVCWVCVGGGGDTKMQGIMASRDPGFFSNIVVSYILPH
jgi:hypothetical protein